MSFLNRNVNFVLLTLMIVLMIVFTGTTVYFQRSYQGMNDKYNTKVGEVESLIVAVKSEQNRSAELHEAYIGCSNQTGEEQKGFNYVVSDLSKSKENLNKTLLSTQSELSSTILKLSNTENELQATENELDDAKADLKKAEDEKVELNKLIDKYDRWIEDLSGHSNTLQIAIADYISSQSTPADCDDILANLKGKSDAVDDDAHKLAGMVTSDE
jgi:chromosome segregation ATPase